MDDCDDVTMAAEGRILLACHCTSNDFATSSRAGAAAEDGMDGYVVKLDPQTGEVLYTTRLGANGHDAALRVAADPSGNAYVAGITRSTAFPATPGAIQPDYGGGNSDAFLAKLDTDGKVLYSTFFGGANADYAGAVTIDATKARLYVAGVSGSDELPGLAAGATPRGGDDGFVAAFDLASGEVLWTIYLGGQGNEKITSVAVDSSGRLFVAGYTDSPDFPTNQPYQKALQGNTDAFLVRLDGPTGRVEYASFFGGSAEDSAWGLALDAAGNPHICVITNSANMPVTPESIQPTLGGGTDAFVAKFDPMGQRLLYGTYYGGNGEDSCGYDGADLAIDSSGHAWLVGMTDSQDLPLRHPSQTAFGGGELDGFVAAFEPGGTLRFATYYGGTDRDLLEGVTISESGVYVTGLAASRDIPSAGKPVQEQHAGGRFDVMLARFATPAPNE